MSTFDSVCVCVCVCVHVHMHTCVCECVCAHVLSCVSLCDPMGWCPLGFSIPGIFQARILEWIAISFSRDLHNRGILSRSLEFPALASRFFTTEPSGKPNIWSNFFQIMKFKLRKNWHDMWKIFILLFYFFQFQLLNLPFLHSFLPSFCSFILSIKRETSI